MTRQKEIEQAMKDAVAETIYASGWGMAPQATDLLECAFTKGAEWADRNPNPDTIRKVFEFALNNTNLLIAYSSDAVDWGKLVKQAIKE